MMTTRPFVAVDAAGIAKGVEDQAATDQLAIGFEDFFAEKS